MSERKETKWICEYCTYENYPSSLKCTMCRGPKPLVNEDIYRLHGNDEKIANQSDNIASACESKSNKKWSCEACLYMNPSHEQVCTQCGTSAPATANTLHEYIQPLKITQHSDVAQSLSQSRNNSPPASVTNLENTRRTSQNKWSCTVS